VDVVFGSGAGWRGVEIVGVDDADAPDEWGTPPALILFGPNEINSSRMARGIA
jgi:hypothetical protein